MKKYLFDTNFFLDSDLRYYNHTFFAEFWNLIQYLSKKDSFRSIKKVKKELIAKEDWVSKFIKNLPQKFFIDETKYMESYIEVIKHSQNLSVNNLAKEKFADENKADAWLVAVALKNKYTIISNEKFIDNKERKHIKIPRICKELKIECMDIFNFIAENKFEFGIKKPKILQEVLF